MIRAWKESKRELTADEKNSVVKKQNESFLHVSTIKLNDSNRPSESVKPVKSGQSEKRQKLAFKTDYRLIQVILQYFRPSVSYYWPLRPLFCLF